MRITFSTDFQKELKKIKKRDPKLTELIRKQLVSLKQNPRHPSLRLHKLSGNFDQVWSISVSTKIRMTYIQKEDDVYFVDIGTHDQVYRK